jgi:S-adenosylmethionine synthetase
MSEKRIEVAEHVLPGHPDKLCDALVDNIVEFVTRRDPLAQCGLEASCVFDSLFLTGRVAYHRERLKKRELKFHTLIREAYATAGYGQDAAGYLWGPDPEKLKIRTRLCNGYFAPGESELRHLSDDQAICVGYANSCEETDYLPPAQWLARRIARELYQLRKQKGAGHIGPDGKVIVRIEAQGEYWKPLHVSISLNHHEGSDWMMLRQVAEEAVAVACTGKPMPEVLLNGAGMFISGGPNGDNGLSGKKLVVDAYGPGIPIGGGAWSGKDFRKVDRLGGLLARELALKAVSRGLGSEARVVLEYNPGCNQPVSIDLICDDARQEGNVIGMLGSPDVENYSVSSRYIHELFNEDQGDSESLMNLARWGHQVTGIPWEITDSSAFS